MIPLSQTSTPVQFYNVLSTFDVATRASLENLLVTLNQRLQPGARGSRSRTAAPAG